MYTILLQPYTKRIDVARLSAITMVGGAVPLLIASTPALIATDWSIVGPSGWLALFYSSVISMGVAYYFWYRGLRVLGPTRTAVYANLQPIIALAVAWASSRGTNDFPGSGRGYHRCGRLPDQSMRLVLFDIDGTLLTSEGMGRAAMRARWGKRSGRPATRRTATMEDGQADRARCPATRRPHGRAYRLENEKLIEVYLDGLRSAPKAGSSVSVHSRESWKSWMRSIIAKMSCWDC